MNAPDPPRSHGRFGDLEDSFGDELLTTGQVAKVMRVDPKTVARWVKAKKIPAITTPGGHRRVRRSVVEAILAADGT